MQTDIEKFREEFRRRLEGRPEVALRLALAPRWQTPLEFTGPELLAKSLELAARYAPAQRRAVVLLLLPHSPELFLLHFGLVLSGHVPAIVAWPTSRVDPEKYQRNLLHQLQKLPAHALITLPHLAASLGPGLGYPAAGCPVEDGDRYETLFPAAPVAEGLTASARETSDLRPPDDTLFLQFSGGTTGAQKAVPVTAAMLTAQLERLAESIELSGRDHVVSWLPLYHDMGLIACLWLPAWHGIPSLHMGANDWVLKPELLFEYITKYHGTLAWLPNFAFSYLAQRRARIKETHRLGQMRAWINCSEPVRRRSMLAFAAAFADWGVEPGALQASYAMAESVFAVTQTKLGVFPAVTPRSQMRANARSYNKLAFDLIDDVLVSSGSLLPDTLARVVNGDGPCADGAAGEIQIKTPSLFSGYWGSDGFRRTSLTEDGWHATGDYGFVDGGEVYVVGRIKDIIIIGGQNVFPEDVEGVVNEVSGISPGRVVAFGVEDQDYGTETIAVVAEAAGEFDEEKLATIETEIRQMVLAAVGIAPRYVLVAPQRWIVKSTAGKISRRDTRERFIRERLLGARAEVA
jgi:fatty-acyl-CoA synthase